MTSSQQQARLNRHTLYTFSCARCRRCCHAKVIQVNPYEVARLAARLGLSTTAFIRRHLRGNGAHLDFGAENVCPFLTATGCGVHPDRPLVCRLYPLGRHVAENGEEWFTELEAEADCAGRRSAEATVFAYVDAQGALPYMRAADLYLALYWKLSSLLENSDLDDGSPRSMSDSWADLDASVAQFCAERRIPVPTTLEDRMLLHIQAIETWALAPEKEKHHAHE